ncbi:energy transducer TonB [Mucilaginibacter pallidiroseus]|nr:energy transducer TonB [Mucilaginibacter pallidiroseus]
MDSQPRLITKSLNTDGLLQTGATGPCMEYYHNGKRKSIRNYNRGIQIEDELTYYPNGKLYTIKTYLNNAVSLNTCYDSLGVLMAENGNGNWVDFDDEFLVKEEGIVINGKKDGVWRHTHNVSGNIYYDNGVESHPDIEANFVGGHNKLDAYLNRAIKFRYQGSYNNKHGRLMMTFRVEKDGAITNAKIIRNVDLEFDKIALESLQRMPKWSPTKFRGQPVSSIVPLTIMVSNTGYSSDSIPTQNTFPARKVSF